MFRRVLFYNVFGLFVGAVAIECIFGGWLKELPLNQLVLPRAIRMEVDVSQLYARQEKVVHQRDAFGFRGQYKDVAQLDLLTVGGSTTAQRYITEGETWQDVVQNLYARKRLHAIQVANAGVNGQSTVGHLLNFSEWFPKIPNLRSKLTLVYVGLNDLYVQPGEVLDQVVTDNPNPTKSWRTLVVHNSSIFHLFNFLKGLFLATDSDVGYARRIPYENLRWTQVGTQKNYKFIEPRVTAYRNRLTELVSRIRKTDSVPLLMTQVQGRYHFDEDGLWGVQNHHTQDGRRINGVDTYHLMEAINAETRSTCERLNVECFDLATELRFDVGDFYDWVHVSPSGNRKIGEYLFKKLERVLYLPGTAHRSLPARSRAQM